VPSRDLYDYGFEVMGSAGTRSTPLKEAGQYRDGLMIALLAARPVRRKNLASIEIGRHLVGQGTVYLLRFPGQETKTGRALEFPLPQALTGPVDFYIKYHRPFLIGSKGRWKRDPGDALWLSDHGSPMSASQLGARISQRTREGFGLPINPHLFRDAAATSIAIEDPEHVGIVTTILGHSNGGTAEAYYNQATSIEAARRYQDVIGAFR
jgi:integrase/recombinase XerD